MPQKKSGTSYQDMTEPTPLPATGAPAERALADAGIRSLEDLRGRDVEELAVLHGVGPKAIRLLKEALAEGSNES
ncbi:helix-hairpin-helix domain-containing protein [Herbiconiux sp. P17]|uniref:helix-hairpin-helix domain-containing protein n=1 Tax=Herbiconiux wuyangfengii TaxID=3342794 RepID=UPI0035B7982A